jgi:hypothetical protein
VSVIKIIYIFKFYHLSLCYYITVTILEIEKKKNAYIEKTNHYREARGYTNPILYTSSCVLLRKCYCGQTAKRR